MAEDLYQVLGVDRTATADDIKRAYRRLAHQHHPDKSGGDEEKFKHINAAYQVLSDPAKRAKYDRFGATDDMGGGAGGPFSGFGTQGFNINVEDLGGFGDIFEQFFGGAGPRRARRRGQDVSVDVEISFIESAARTKKQISLRLLSRCNTCQGNGAKPGTLIISCATCGGSGTVSQTQQTMFGVFAQRTVCTTCGGEGKVPKEACPTCRGEGRVRQQKTLAVTIPAGIADGQMIRIDGQGEAAPRGGEAGDLYVRVHVKSHPHLQRDGRDIHTNAAISFIDATLGTAVQVDTLEGKKAISIPAGTQPGSEIRLSHAGFPSIGGSSRGDEIVTITVTIPKKVTRQQKQLLEEFNQSQAKKRFF